MTVPAYTLDTTSCDGTLAIDGHALSTPAWHTPDLSDLYGTPTLRGTDRVLPGVTGVRAYRRRATVTLRSLPFLVTGQVDRFGTPYPDPDAGLQTNIAYLNANVLLPTNVGDGTRSFVWTLVDASTVAVSVHVLGLGPRRRLPGALLKTTLELSFPDGDIAL